MCYDIAAYVDKHGFTISLYDPGKLVIYRKGQGNWQACREKEFNPAAEEGLSGLRRMMGEILDFMGDCRVFVGYTVSGIPYFELEKSKCSVWEIGGNPQYFLDYILSYEEKEQSEEQKNMAAVVPAPVEIGAGRYRVSIKEIQESGGGITSKQVLRPFLRRGEFFELEVICSHVPPWLEAEFAAGAWKGEISGDGKRIIISKMC